jgi:hypothetical protein
MTETERAGSAEGIDRTVIEECYGTGPGCRRRSRDHQNRRTATSRVCVHARCTDHHEDHREHGPVRPQP